VGHDEVDATSLLAHPKNGRIHPSRIGRIAATVDALA
jgi:hypothetical protein